jgi:hypothetical protein
LKIKIIYLLGAGRSGTTLLGTILNSHSKICTIGEMHQFPDYLLNNKACSCGDKLTQCEFWRTIIKLTDFSGIDLENLERTVKQKESHTNILKLLFKTKVDEPYLKFHNLIFESISKQHKEQLLLDSSKYIARYLLLKKSDKLNIKGIYVTRDVRGVINSFSKKVQTPKSAIGTIIYYMLINSFAELLSLMDKDIIKIKYEDFINAPLPTLNKIYNHVLNPQEKAESISKIFDMPHIIGGNRMKKKSKITIEGDEKWKNNICRPKQIIYYILAAPIMLLNRYKI